MSSAFDGSDQRVIASFENIDIVRPIDLARLLSVPGVKLVSEAEDVEPTYYFRLPGLAKAILLGDVRVSSGGRFLSGLDMEGDGTFLFDFRAGKRLPLKVRFEDPAWIDNESVIYAGGYDPSRETDPSAVGIYDAKSSTHRQVQVSKLVDGERLPSDVFHEGHAAMNFDGGQAYWFGSGGKAILMQQIERTLDGGLPGIWCFSAKSGVIRFEIGGEFLEDVALDRTHFLATTWKWGKGWHSNGTTALRKLVIWDGKTLHGRQLGFDLAFCQGACFIPEGGR